MCLYTAALPRDMKKPRAKVMVVNSAKGMAMVNSIGPCMPSTTTRVGGDDRKNRQHREAEDERYITWRGPQRSESQPPKARKTAADRENRAVSIPAWPISSSYFPV